MTSLDKSYARYLEGGSATCKVSISGVEEAERLLGAVLRAFRMPAALDGRRVLDLGCGLGCVSEALRRRGASVLALDNSPRAIEHVRQRYPGVEARCTPFGADFRDAQGFDLIWMRDFSLCNTFDWEQLEREVLLPCRRLLRPGGSLLMGQRSSFTGEVDGGNWANWRYDFLRRLRREHGAEGPLVVQLPGPVGHAALAAARLLHRKLPFYLRMGPAASAPAPSKQAGERA